MYDIAVIGGGINGCGIARDACGRGLKVLLVEKADLASGTSSASTKLIHGGLRYLEHYEFKLVRESLQEREVLLRAAPHIIRPLRFVLPHHAGLRPAYLLRLGLFLYDNLGSRQILPGSRGLDLRSDVAGKPLKPEFVRGFEYSDCWVDDARLVVLNAVDAARRGADIRVGTEMVRAERGAQGWRIELKSRPSAARQMVEARVLVNAAGPWAGDLLAGRITSHSQSRVRLVKGSHIVVRRIFEHDRAYIFQNADRRIMFAIPYEGDFTLIGTTDVDYQGDPGDVAIDSDEISYLAAAASAYFVKPIAPADVVWSYAGVRPLVDEGGVSAQEATRDFVLELEGSAGEPALLSVLGGKITTFRHLAEVAMQKLAPYLGTMGPPWTHRAPLPGGDFPVDGFETLVDLIAGASPAVERPLVRRLARAYGTVAAGLLAGVSSKTDLGHHFGAGLHEREVRHLVANEWARSADDILWRRTKLGLSMSAAEKSRLEEFLAADSAVAQRSGLG